MKDSIVQGFAILMTVVAVSSAVPTADRGQNPKALHDELYNLAKRSSRMGPMMAGIVTNPVEEQAFVDEK